MTDPTAPEILARTHQAAFDHSRTWDADEFRSLLSSPLVFATGDARCFALVRVVAGEAELLTLATHPDHQRQGHARRIMTAWHAEAQQRGATEAFLEVAADNDAAQALYLAAGYTTVATRAGYYMRTDGTRVDALIMRCTFTDQ